MFNEREAQEIYALNPDMYEQGMVLLQPEFVQKVFESEEVGYFKAFMRQKGVSYVNMIEDPTPHARLVEAAWLDVIGDATERNYYFVTLEECDRLCGLVDNEELSARERLDQECEDFIVSHQAEIREVESCLKNLTSRDVGSGLSILSAPFVRKFVEARDYFKDTTVDLRIDGWLVPVEENHYIPYLEDMAFGNVSPSDYYVVRNSDYARMSALVVEYLEVLDNPEPEDEECYMYGDTRKFESPAEAILHALVKEQEVSVEAIVDVAELLGIETNIALSFV